jgi:hypothetical protein
MRKAARGCPAACTQRSFVNGRVPACSAAPMAMHQSCAAAQEDRKSKLLVVIETSKVIGEPV